VIGAALLLVPWALIGFDGLRQYPALLHALQGVYARVSLSLATAAAGLGASTTVATAVATVAGLALIGLGWWLARGPAGDRRSFAVFVGACIVGSPIVWQNYLALLFVPIAITWPRLALPWFFGFAVWLMALLPKPTVPKDIPCCRPSGTPEAIWEHSHASPAWGHAGGTTAVVLAVVAWCVLAPRVRGSSLALRPRRDGLPSGSGS
jgi:hypothetical protein